MVTGRVEAGARIGGAIFSASIARSRRRADAQAELEAPTASEPPDHAVSFTLIAVGTAFVLVMLPSNRHDYAEIAEAGILGAALVVLAFSWPRLPHIATLGVPIGYLLFASLLRDAAGGSASGFGGLFLLPVLWLALSAGQLELAAGLVAMCLAQLVPLVVVGAPRYPSSGWRAVVVLTSVAAITGLMVQRLVGEARRRAAVVQRQAEDVALASARLSEQNERLLELDRLKDEFIAVVSHELRTPLTSISGYLEMALEPDEGPISPTRQQYLATVQRNVGRLTRLVNDLLFLARNDSQQFTLDRQPVDLKRILDEAAESVRPATVAGRIELRVEAESLPPVLGDHAQLLQLVDNLVSNAVKFTPEGGRVELAAHRQADLVVLTVADTGAGISAEELPKLFERFFRASNATRNAVPGTGLGLAISQVIAEAHGSTIEVESTLGAGTTFHLSLSVAAPGSNPALS